MTTPGSASSGSATNGSATNAAAEPHLEDRSRRRFVHIATGAIAAYALVLMVLWQAEHVYPGRGPAALEDTRPRQMDLGQYWAAPERRFERLLAHGWYGREGSAPRWSAGLSSVVVLPAQDPDQDLRLTLRLTAARDPSEEDSEAQLANAARVSLHGHELGSFEVLVDRVDDYVVRIPAHVHRGHAMPVLLAYSYTLQPGPNDPRDIAVALHGLRLDRAE